MFKSGFVTIIGKPNVGKSTFLNQVLGQKITITSDKPQTTRNTIRGIYTDEDAQIVFLDTPGIHHGKHKLGHTMTESALRTLNSVDLVLYMISGLEKLNDVDKEIIKRTEKLSTPVFLIVNKIDLIKDIKRLEENIESYKQAMNFKAVFAISALQGIHTDALIKDIKSELEPGPKYYPDDEITDHPEKFLISERIREKVLELTQEEVPHSVMVTIDDMHQDEEYEHVLNIHASIIVERDSQKGIIIGKQGRLIKQIGTRARKDILDLLGTKIFLDLHVKVIKDWRNKEHYLRNFGYQES